MTFLQESSEHSKGGGYKSDPPVNMYVYIYRDIYQYFHHDFVEAASREPTIDNQSTYQNLQIYMIYAN